MANGTVATLMVVGGLLCTSAAPAFAQYRVLHIDGTAGQVQSYEPTERTQPQTSVLTLMAASAVGTVHHSEIVTHPSGEWAYVSRDADVAVVNIMTGAVTAWTAVSTPGPLAITADGTRLFVASRTSTIVAVLDTTTGAAAQTVAFGHQASDMALSPDGRWLAISHRENSSQATVSVMDVEGVSITSYPVDDLGGDIAISPDGAVVYVATATSVRAHARVGWAVVDTLVVASAQVRSNLALSPDGATLLVGFGAVQGETTASDLYRYNTSARELTVMLTRGWGTVTWSADGLRVVAMVHNEAVSPSNQRYTPWVFRDAIWREFPVFPSVNPVTLVTTPVPACEAATASHGLIAGGRVVPMEGGSVSVPFSMPSGCTASATTTTPWLSVDPVTPSNSRWQVTVTATAGFARTGFVRLPGRDVPIRQQWSVIHVDVPASGGSYAQPLTVSGWAFVKDGLSSDNGVNSVAIWAHPRSGGAPVGIAATINRARSDIEQVYGMANAGWHATLSGLTAGTWDLVAYVQSRYNAAYTAAAPIAVTVQSDGPVEPEVVIQIDSVASGSTLPQPAVISGWAIDRTAPSGTAIDRLQAWAFPVGGGTATFLGAPAIGLVRPDNDIRNAYGDVVTHPGFAILADNLTPGTYDIAIYAHGTRVTGTFWSGPAVVRVTLQGAAEPGSVWVSAVPSPQFALQGYALDRGAASGPGVATVHVWAYPSNGAAVFLGAATPGADASTNRPELVPLFGADKAASGWRLTGLSLPAGTYTIVAYGYSTVTGSFSNVRTTTLTIGGS